MVLESFQLVQTNESEKRVKGGGMIIFINPDWYNLEQEQIKLLALNLKSQDLCSSEGCI